MTLLERTLRRPMSVLVAVIAIALAAVVALDRMPRDVFPALGVPTIYVAQPFGGMDPAQMEGYLTYYYEYHFLYINGIERVESKSIQGASIMKLQFHPGTDMSSAMSEVVAYVNRARAFMPAGTPGPFMMRFDAGSVPVGYLTFSTDDPGITLGQMQDAALNRVRPLFATLPGVSAPPPFGGSARSVVVNVNAERMRAYGLSPDDIVKAMSAANVLSPSGNMTLGDQYPIVPVNSVVRNVKDLEAVPLRLANGRAVFVRDLAKVEDASDIVTSYALANGLRTVYIPVTKRADASTLAVVNLVKDNIEKFQSVVPAGVKVSFEFDQSPVVTHAITELVKEGALGALLTGLMVLLFLRDWRSVLVVVVNIPLALLTASVALWLCGQTINLMTLGGLALAVGILVDEATVTMENIHTHLARGASVALAARDATRETALPRLLAMLAIVAVFIPALFMTGAAKALFVPMALAVGFSMIASFLLSSTLVPVLTVWLLRAHRPAPDEASGGAPAFARLQARYAGGLRRVIALRWPLLAVYLLLAAGIIGVGGRYLGLEIFPQVNAQQFAIRFRAPTGTRVDLTEALAKKVLDSVKREVGAEQVAFTIGLVGVHAPNYPVNLIHLWNGGPEEGWLAIQLKPDSDIALPALKERLRQTFAREYANVRFSFEPSDIISRVMSFGSFTPVEVAISGPSLAASKAHAEKLLEKLKQLPALRDLQIAQSLDFPTVDVNVDREQAGLLGVQVSDVARSLVAATTSSRFTVANFWADPGSGIAYNLQVQIPQAQTNSVEDLQNLPISGANGPVLLRSVASVAPGVAAGTYERYNGVRVISITANLHGIDLGTATRQIASVIDQLGAPADGKTSVVQRGQVVPLMELLDGFEAGLAIAVIVIFLLLAAHYESLQLSLIVMMSAPAAIAGVVLALLLTHTTLNLQSAMGAIMSIGVAVANAILLVTFAERARLLGGDAGAAAIDGARSRLRPILMTSLAMVAGMLPMALGLGDGGGQMAPLGRAVIGGLTLATLTTLFVLPACFALIRRRAGTQSRSLDPGDPSSGHFVASAVADGSPR